MGCLVVEDGYERRERIGRCRVGEISVGGIAEGWCVGGSGCSHLSEIRKGGG